MEASAPGATATCSACGWGLAKLPEGSSRGLTVREDRGGAHEDGALLALDHPKHDAAVALLLGLVWTVGLGSVAALVWICSEGGGGLFVALVAVASVGMVLAIHGARGLVSRIEISVTATWIAVGTKPGNAVRAFRAAEILGFSVQRDAFARYEIYALLRNGRGERLPYVFDRQTNAVWTAERLDTLMAERTSVTPYRGLPPKPAP